MRFGKLQKHFHHEPDSLCSASVVVELDLEFTILPDGIELLSCLPVLV